MLYILPQGVPVTVTVDPSSDVKLHAISFDLDKPDTEAVAAFEKLLGQVREQETLRRRAAS